MKKTLITLAALAMASVASAADYPTPDLATDPTTDRVWAPAVSPSYTWIAVMDWDTAIATLGDWQSKSSLFATDNQHAEAALGVRLFKDGTTIKTMVAEHNNEKWFKNYEYTTNGLTVAGDGSSVAFDQNTYERLGKLAITFSYDDTAKTYTLGALKADGTLATLTIEKAADWDVWDYNGVDLKGVTPQIVDQFVWFDSALSAPELTAAAVAYVPEPTTATLSLLALAGLAARRRRK